MNRRASDRRVAEARFIEVFGQLGAVAAYARRRGTRDPDGIAAEAMTVAWRRLADIPSDDARPWLFATARNLLAAERRRGPAVPDRGLDGVDPPAPVQPLSARLDVDPDLAAALRALSEPDREALLLIAWEDLTPSQAAASLGITPAAFRVRLHRARRRLADRLTERVPAGGLPPVRAELEADMTEERLMRRLAAANPAPLAAESPGAPAVFAQIVAMPGDARLVAAPHRLPRWLRGPRRLAIVAAMFVLVAAGGTAGVGLLAHERPGRLFGDNPEAGPGLWHQTVVSSSVHRARSFSIPGVGRMSLWVAETRQHGFCTALRLPDGAWSGLDASSLDVGGTVPGCQPTRAQVNHASRVYVLDGFQYDEALVRGAGATVWRVEYGRVTPRRGVPVAVRDVDNGERVPVTRRGWFAIVLRDRRSRMMPHWRLQALDARGRVIAQEPEPGA